MEDTYLQRTTQISDAKRFAHADFSPDGQQVAYSWLDEDTGWVRFLDTATGEATRPARVPVSKAEQWASGTWHPQGQRYIATCVTFECAGPAVVLDPATGRVLERRELFDGDVWSIGYIDGNRSLLVGGSTVHGEGWGPHNRIRIFDAETLQPQGEPLSITAHNVIPIGDGSTAMVQEISSDFDSAHWRVIDFSTGEVDVLSEGDLNFSVNAFAASPDGSTVALAADTGEIVTIDVSTADEQRQSSDLESAVLWLKYSDDGELLVSTDVDGGVSLWDATTLDPLGSVYTPHQRDPSRPARSSSATPTTWRSPRTTARSTGGRPTSTGPSTTPARWPDGT